MTRPTATPRARRVQVSEDEPLLHGTHDYADAFEIHVAEPDARDAEELARSALEAAPGPVRWLIWLVHRHVLRFRLAPSSSPQHVLGWTIRTADADVVHLEATSPLLRAAIIGRRPTDLRAHLPARRAPPGGDGGRRLRGHRPPPCRPAPVPGPHRRTLSAPGFSRR